jgi:hypothetical protein
VPTKIFGLKGEEVTLGWIKLHNAELPDSYSTPAIIRAIISRSMRLADYVARVGEKKTERGHIEDINRIILI